MRNSKWHFYGWDMNGEVLLFYEKISKVILGI